MKTTRSFLLAASVSLALALTFSSCSSDDGDGDKKKGDDNGGGGEKGCIAEGECKVVANGINEALCESIGYNWDTCPSGWEKCTTLYSNGTTTVIYYESGISGRGCEEEAQ